MKHTNYDALFCGHQPIHNINSIQPHGCLMVMELETMNVVQVSANIDRLLQMPAEQVFNQPFSAFVAPECVAGLEEKLSVTSLPGAKIPFSLVLKNRKTFRSFLHTQSDVVIVETEWLNEVQLEENTTRRYQYLSEVMALFDSAATVQQVCDLAVDQIKKLTGFDKVMIYVFDEEWNGTVVAEAAEKGWELYLGLKFPASDIPKPAREMYRRNPYRLISSREYDPVPLIPEINPVTATVTDLSLCHLRSVAPVHREYLKNMNVMAAMSMRILHNGQLWGLVACHHGTSRYFSVSDCAAFELLSHVLSAKISNLLNQESLVRSQALQHHFTMLKEQVFLFKNIPNTFYTYRDTLLTLLSADGVALTLNNNVYTFGATPDENFVLRITEWLQKGAVRKTTAFTSLPYAFEEAKTYADVGSGLLAMPIQPETGVYLMAFRPEAVTKVSWGGNPGEAVNFEKDKLSYHPRNSFSIWKEVVRYTAVRWQPEEVAVAEQLRTSLVELMLLQKNSELQLMINEFQFVADFVPQIVWTATTDGTVDFLNKRGYEYSGFMKGADPDEVWLDMVHPNEQGQAIKQWSEAVRQGTPYMIEYRLRNASGDYGWFLGKALPMRNAEGRIVKWFGTSTDIQQQKEAEKILEQQVQARTMELQKTNVQLQSVNADLLNLTFVASHHLQEPVRKIQVFTNILRDQVADNNNKQVATTASRIAKSAEHIRVLLNDLVQYSTIMDNQAKMDLELNVVVESVLQQLQAVIAEKQAQITVGDLGTLYASEEHMHLLFYHLIDNALKFNKPGEVPELYITAETVNEDRFAGKVAMRKITVKDKGIGFDQKYALKVFDVFQRLHAPGQYSGSGIGLALVKRIVERYDGSVSAQAKDGDGTVITLLFPLA